MKQHTASFQHRTLFEVPMPMKFKRQEDRGAVIHLFVSRPIRKPASPSAASKLPFPASCPVTAYSLTKA